MKKIELLEILQAARTYYEDSSRGFGYYLEAKDRGDVEYSKTAEKISLEYESKMRGLLYAIEVITGFVVGSWYFNDFKNEGIVAMIINFDSIRRKTIE